MRIEPFVLAVLLLLPLHSLGSTPAEPRGEEDETLLCWTDIDGDGLDDVVTRNAAGELVLLQNLGTGGFEDATLSWGLGELGPVRAAQWLELGGDARAELVVLDASGDVRLFRNTGTTLEEASGHGGLELAFAARTMQSADVDRDGRLDLVVAGDGERRLLRNLGELAFEPVVLPRGPMTSAFAQVPVATLDAEDVGPLATGAGSEGEAAAYANESKGTRRPVAIRASGPQRAGAIEVPGTTAPAASVDPLMMSSPLCAPSIQDQVSGACIQAASMPALGRLFPLSTELNVDLAGNVGMGTAAPLAQLHMSDATAGVQPSALLGEDVIFEAVDAVLGLYSWGGGSWGSALAFGEMDANGVLEDKWSIARTTDLAGSSLRFTHGTNPSYALNPARVTFEADGGVGIGTTSAGDDRLRVVHSESTGSAVDATSSGASNTHPAVFGFHTGGGVGVEARTLTGDYAFKGNGMTLTTGAGDYALRASNNGDTAAFFDGAVHIGAPEAPFFNDVPRILMDRDPSNGAGRAIFRNGGQFVSDRIVIEAVRNGGSGAAITMRNGSGVALVLDTDHLGTGKSRITTDVLEISGGADLVEHFDAGEDGEAIEPGTVLVIDPDNAGRLMVAAEPYDKRVAGIVSGAGGIEPGLSMGQEGVASGDTAVALTGRVYVKANCEAGAIVPGDRLTTSSTAGHAMRVADDARAGGAVIGKAMTALEEGTGLVLVLVNLQ